MFKRKIIETANECGLTGMKRAMFYVIAPVVAGVSFTIGYVEGVVLRVFSSINK